MDELTAQELEYEIKRLHEQKLHMEGMVAELEKEGRDTTYTIRLIERIERSIERMMNHADGNSSN